MKNQAIALKLRALFACSFVLALVGCSTTTPAPVIDRGTPIVVDAPAKDLYTVKKGDTLRSIASAHGIDFRDLIVWNAIDNPNRIQPGVTLRVKPSGAAGSLVGSAPSTGSDVAVAKPIAVAPVVEQRSLDSAPTGGSPVGTNTALLKREPKGGKETYSEAALARAQSGAKAAESATPAGKTDSVAPATAAPAVAAGPDDVAWIWPNNGKIIGTFSEGGSKGVDIAGKAGDPVLAAGEGKVVYSGTGLRGYGKLVIVKHNETYLSAYAHNQNVLVKEGQSVTKGQKIAEMGNTDADQVKLHFEVRRQGKPVDPLKYLPSR